MPHSVSPEDPVSPDQNATIEEPKTENVETQESEGTAVADSVGLIGESQASDDQDITMADAGAVEEKTPIKVEATAEVKLEDLFADMDSDEEFPSSTGQDVKISSSPEAPASPV
jgi:DNA primase small subunit